MSTLSINGISKILKTAAPGAYTPESITKAREILEDIAKHIATSAREIANHSGKKRVTEEEIKMAAKYLIR